MRVKVYLVVVYLVFIEVYNVIWYIFSISCIIIVEFFGMGIIIVYVEVYFDINW